MKKRQWFDIQAKADTAEIYIYDAIGSSMWGDSITAKEFIDTLNTLKDVKSITLRLNSPGGEVFDATAIYNALLRHPATVNVEIDGLAASMASVIAMAGETIGMAENAMMMIHDPWAMSMGSAAEMRKVADQLDKAKETLLVAYTRKSPLPQDRISAMMAAETWFTAKEAKGSGFITSISEPVKMAACYDLGRFGYKRTPDAVKNLLVQDEPEPKKEGAEPQAKASNIDILKKRLELAEAE